MPSCHDVMADIGGEHVLDTNSDSAVSFRIGGPFRKREVNFYFHSFIILLITVTALVNLSIGYIRTGVASDFWAFILVCVVCALFPSPLTANLPNYAGR